MKTPALLRLVVGLVSSLCLVEAQIGAYDSCVRGCGFAALAALTGCDNVMRAAKVVCENSKRTCKLPCDQIDNGCSAASTLCKGGCSFKGFFAGKKKKNCKKKCDKDRKDCKERAAGRCRNTCDDLESSCKNLADKAAKTCRSAVWLGLENTCWDGDASQKWYDVPCGCNKLGDEPGNDEKRRLKYQHYIDSDVAFVDATFVGTHNSYNIMKDRYPLPNQRKTIPQQLDHGFRIINYDLHENKDEVVMCHDSVSGGYLCSPQDRKWEGSLRELKTWVDNNPDEFVLVMIEDYLGDVRDKAIQDIDSILKDRVLYPKDVLLSTEINSGHPEFPIEDSMFSKGAILNTHGKQILLTTGEKKADTEWRKRVWYLEVEAYGDGADLPTNEGMMPTDHLSAIFEDLAIKGILDQDGILTGEKIKDSVENGVNLIGLDFGGMINRMEAAIWSWGQQEPSASCTSNCCAVMSTDNSSWKLKSCTIVDDSFYVACRNTDDTSSDYGKWAVSPSQGHFGEGDLLCGEIGSGWVFDRPTNGNYNKQLADSRATATEVLINYKFN